MPIVTDKNHQHAHIFSVVMIFIVFFTVSGILFFTKNPAESQRIQKPYVSSGEYRSSGTVILTFNEAVYTNDGNSSTCRPDFKLSAYNSDYMRWSGWGQTVDIARSLANASPTVTITLNSPIPTEYTRDVFIVLTSGTGCSNIKNANGIGAGFFSYELFNISGAIDFNPPVHGQCSTTQDTCSSGTFEDRTDDTTRHFWRCKGQNGGRDANCTTPKGSSCSAETKNNCVLPKTVSGYRTLAACADGYVGECWYSCADGVWKELYNLCDDAADHIPPCTTETIDDCRIQTPPGGISSGNYHGGRCVNATEGECRYTCGAGGWTEETNTCQIVVADTIAPILTPRVAGLDEENNNTPTYTFASSEDGYVVQTKSTCQFDSSMYMRGQILISEGENVIKLHRQQSDSGNRTCTIIGIDYSRNESAPLTISYNVPAYNDGTTPVLTEVTKIPAATSTNSPAYTFQSSELGLITYSGTCVAGSWKGLPSFDARPNRDTTVVLRELRDGTYSDCRIIVTDRYGNAGTLDIPPFTVEWEPNLADYIEPERIPYLSEGLKAEIRAYIKAQEPPSPSLSGGRNNPLGLINKIANEYFTALNSAPVQITVTYNGANYLTAALSKGGYRLQKDWPVDTITGSDFLDDFEVQIQGRSSMTPTSFDFGHVGTTGNRMVFQLPGRIPAGKSATLVYTKGEDNLIGRLLRQVQEGDTLVNYYETLESFSEEISWAAGTRSSQSARGEIANNSDIQIQGPSVTSVVYNSEDAALNITLTKVVFSKNRYSENSRTVGGRYFLDDFVVRLNTGSDINPTKITLNDKIITVKLAESIPNNAVATLVYTQDPKDRIGRYYNVLQDSTNRERIFEALESFSRTVERQQTIIRSPTQTINRVAKQQPVESQGQEEQSSPQSSNAGAPETPEGDEVYTISGTHTQGNISEEVRYTQILLNRSNCPIAETGAGSPGNETNVFGAKTRSAVICYQRELGAVETGQITPDFYGSLVANYWIR